MSWQNIPRTPDMRNVDLMVLIYKHKPLEKSFKIDELIKNRRHTVLRLPPFMCELNSIELACARMKYYIRERNITGDMSITSLIDLTQGYINHVVKYENEYWEVDR